VIITLAVKDEDIPTKFPKGCTKVKPYLRYTPQPNAEDIKAEKTNPSAKTDSCS